MYCTLLRVFTFLLHVALLWRKKKRYYCISRSNHGLAGGTIGVKVIYIYIYISFSLKQWTLGCFNTFRVIRTGYHMSTNDTFTDKSITSIIKYADGNIQLPTHNHLTFERLMVEKKQVRERKVYCELIRELTAQYATMHEGYFILCRMTASTSENGCDRVVCPSTHIPIKGFFSPFFFSFYFLYFIIPMSCSKE